MKKNLLSIRTKAISALLLGVTLTFSLPTHRAFAATGEEEKLTIQIESVAPIDEAIYNKQVEIDQYLFKDHAKDVEEKGFKVLTTTVINGKVEIGITPYSEENANYLYELFGKDFVTIVEADNVILMDEAVTTMPDSTMAITTAPDAANSSSGLDTPVSSDAVTTNAEDSIVTTTAADISFNATGAQEMAPVKSSTSTSTPTVAVLGGLSVIVLGGIFFLTNRRKTVK